MYKLRMEEGWSACLQTLEGYSDCVQSVAFSYDSKLIASASYGSTVKVRDASSGKCLQTLEGHRVTSVKCNTVSYLDTDLGIIYLPSVSDGVPKKSNTEVTRFKG